MKTKILSITVVLSLLLTMLSVPVAMAEVETEDIVVYSQNFDDLIGTKGTGITGKDEAIAATGEKAESASTVRVVSEPENGRFLESFAAIADTSGLDNVKAAVKKAANVDIISGNENNVMTASVENHVLKLDKTATGSTGTVYFDLSDSRFVGSLSDYTVEFDLKTAFTSAHTVNVTLGADFSIRCADFENQLCTIEWHNGTAWVATDKTKYDFSDFQHITLAVRTDANGTKTVDLYVGEGEDRVLAYENVPQRNANNFKKLGITVGSGAICQMYIDNLGVTTALPEARGDVFYTENFDGLESVPSCYVTGGADYGTVSVVDDALVVDKTQTGGAPYFDFAITEYLKNATSYSIAFDLKTDMVNSTSMLYLGAGVAFRPVADQSGMYTVEYYYTAADETETSGFKAVEGFTVDLANPVNVRIEVADKASANVMINGEYLMASETDKLTLTQRSGYAWDKFAVRFGNGAKGTMTIDNVAITRGTAVYAAPEDGAELAETDGFLQIAKLYNFNGTATRFDFSNLLCGADDYTASMNIFPKLTAGSINVYMGAFFEFDRTSEGVYRINYREGAETSNKVLAENIVFDDYRNLAIKVTDGASFGLYLDDELIKDGIIARDGYSASNFYIFRNNGMMGNVYVDDLKLTLHTARATGTSVSGEENFENFTTGPVVEQVGKIRTSSTPDKGVLSVEKVDDTHGNALRLYTSFNNENSPYYVSRNYSDIAKSADRYTVEFETMLKGKQSYSIAEKRSGGGGFKINLDLTFGYVKYQKDGTWVNAEDFAVESDTWYKIKYDIDTAANLADVYIDDVLLVEDLDSYQDSPCGGLTLATNKGTQGSMYFDNLKVTVVDEKEAYVSAQYEEGAIVVDGYMPAGDASRLFIAYFDAQSDGVLLDVDIIPCEAGKVIEKTITEVPEGAVSVNVMLWKADITPVCANARLIIEAE